MPLFNTEGVLKNPLFNTEGVLGNPLFNTMTIAKLVNLNFICK